VKCEVGGPFPSERCICIVPSSLRPVASTPTNTSRQERQGNYTSTVAAYSEELNRYETVSNDKTKAVSAAS
jgi:hypothetical protein